MMDIFKILVGLGLILLALGINVSLVTLFKPKIGEGTGAKNRAQKSEEGNSGNNDWSMR